MYVKRISSCAAHTCNAFFSLEVIFTLKHTHIRISLYIHISNLLWQGLSGTGFLSVSLWTVLAKLSGHWAQDRIMIKRIVVFIIVMPNCFCNFLHKLEPNRFRELYIHTYIMLVGRTISRIDRYIILHSLYIYYTMRKFSLEWKYTGRFLIIYRRECVERSK